MPWKKWRWKDGYLTSLDLVIHPNSDVTPSEAILVSSGVCRSVVPLGHQHAQGGFFSLSWEWLVWVFVKQVMLLGVLRGGPFHTSLPRQALLTALNLAL